MKIVIVGAGGIGGYFGARWAAAGLDVTLVARGAHLAAIRSTGLAVKSALGDVSTMVQATDTPVDIPRPDLLLFATKTWQLPDAISSTKSLAGPNTMVLGLQNGVEAVDELQRAFGADRVLGGSCRIISFIESPGLIRHAGGAPIIFIGEPYGGMSGRVELLQRELGRGAGMTVEGVADIRQEIWRKIHWFAPLAAVGSATRATAGEFRESSESRALLRDAMEEVGEVAAAAGVLLPDDVTEKAMEFVDALPYDATSSMMRDFRDGKRTELESLTGAVVRLAESYHVEVPVHRFLYAVLLPQELRARKLSVGR